MDLSKLDLPDEDIRQIKELDFMYGGKTTADELKEMEDEEESRLFDPYLKKKQRMMKD